MDFDEAYGRVPDVFGSEPERTLRAWVDRLDKQGPALDIGAGQGRNARFLAEHGFDVDAINPSAVSIETLEAVAAGENLPVHCHRTDFAAFDSTRSYSAVLIFGLIPILPWVDVWRLIERVDGWLGRNGHVFVTAFTTADGAFKRLSSERREIGPNSYEDGAGHVRTFVRPGETLALFCDYDAAYYWEGLGPEHHHGDGVLERHHIVEAVFKRVAAAR